MCQDRRESQNGMSRSHCGFSYWSRRIPLPLALFAFRGEMSSGTSSSSYSVRAIPVSLGLNPRARFSVWVARARASRPSARISRAPCVLRCTAPARTRLGPSRGILVAALASGWSGESASRAPVPWYQPGPSRIATPPVGSGGLKFFVNGWVWVFGRMRPRRGRGGRRGQGRRSGTVPNRAVAVVGGVPGGIATGTPGGHPWRVPPAAGEADACGRWRPALQRKKTAGKIPERRKTIPRDTERPDHDSKPIPSRRAG